MSSGTGVGTLVWRELKSRQLAAGVAVAVGVGGVLPAMWSIPSLQGEVVVSATGIFRIVMIHSPAALAFPVMAGLPYGTLLSAQVSNRYLTYTRTRVSMGKAMTARYTAAAIAGFAIGFLTTLFVYGWAYFAVPSMRLVTYQPEIYGFVTDAQVRNADAHAFTFSQLTVYGHSVMGLIYAIFLGAVGAAYAMVTASSLFAITNRLLALAAPWLASLVAYFLLAVLGLEAYSPNIFYPFNLKQLSLFYPLLALSGLCFVAFASALAVYAHRAKLSSWQ